ncbi:exodeoxyribonuclease VII small subunit [Aeromicrobium endophyticum]|uniref:Exodeoxyribonuclease 7 small subunit n=1 Tax=Aeromicrobium endophyticum TaxID=2292704 RepID=A0A371P4M1_9ACTN|nr:exodeoxyribonuclease VII small subunit [Aeromicrobium endophyticum]REK70894.1 exodeoxyribonuclease VII small subunit [Aeromicrobium endophyticum]
MPDATTTPETPEIPYEQARDELIAVVARLEQGGTSLDESLTLWERGEHLAGICQQWLDGARARLAAATAAGQDVDSDAM